MHELSHNLYLAHAGKNVDNGKGGQTFDPCEHGGAAVPGLLVGWFGCCGLGLVSATSAAAGHAAETMGSGMCAAQLCLSRGAVMQHHCATRTSTLPACMLCIRVPTRRCGRLVRYGVLLRQPLPKHAACLAGAHAAALSVKHGAWSAPVGQQPRRMRIKCGPCREAQGAAHYSWAAV